MNRHLSKIINASLVFLILLFTVSVTEKIKAQEIESEEDSGKAFKKMPEMEKAELPSRTPEAEEKKEPPQEKKEPKKIETKMSPEEAEAANKKLLEDSKKREEEQEKEKEKEKEKTTYKYHMPIEEGGEVDIYKEYFENRFQIGGAIGFSHPMGSWNIAGYRGSAVAGLYAFYQVHENFRSGLELNYSPSYFHHAVAGVKVSALNAGGVFLLGHTIWKLYPAAVIGVSYYRFAGAENQRTIVDNSAGVSIGGKLDFLVTDNVTTGANVRYHYCFTEVISTELINFLWTFSYKI